MILDVSAGGLLLTSRESYEVEDELSVTNARIVEELDPFAFQCRVRRAWVRAHPAPFGSEFPSAGR